MDQVRVQGSQEVAGLLRGMADGIEAGEVALGGARIPCFQTLTAVVEWPPNEDEDLLLINLRFGTGEHHVRPLALEQELTHPGG